MIEKVINEKFGVGVAEWPLPDSKPAIIFVHGAGGSHQMWLGQLAFFRKDYNPVAINLPGHGLSPGPACDTVKAYADFVLACADALNIQRFILVGLSMGGAISQQIALDAPERLIGLALLSTGAKLKVMPEIFKMIRENYQQYVSLYPGFAFSKNVPKAVVEESMKVVAAMAPESADADFRACDAFNLKDEIKNIKTPTLIISASDDVLTPPKYQDYIASQIQGSKLVRISGAGHVSNLEKPHEVNSALKEFVKEVLEKK